MPNEQRFLNCEDFRAELRVETRAEKPSLITGYPAKFNRKSQLMWGFREVILPGAFKRTLAEGADVRALINHNPDMVLGRSRSGTLRLKEDSTGLRMEIDAPDTQMARDIMTTIGRGDMDQGSFRFRTKTDNWRMEDGETLRELIDVDLMDVSVVTFPAYEDTVTNVRSIAEVSGLDFERLNGILVRHEHKLSISFDDRAFMRSLIQKIEPLTANPDLERRNRRLALADRE